LQYEVHGQGNPAAGMVLLSSGLGGAAQYWSPQIPSLARTFRVITYGHSDTGRSPGMLPDGYSVADMGDEIASLLDKLDGQRCHFIGHALGGLIKLQLALARPALLDRLIVVNAWSKTHLHTLRCSARARACC
jgi:aminoacrylate hydrolase